MIARLATDRSVYLRGFDFRPLGLISSADGIAVCAAIRPTNRPQEGQPMSDDTQSSTDATAVPQIVVNFNDPFAVYSPIEEKNDG